MNYDLDAAEKELVEKIAALAADESLPDTGLPDAAQPAEIERVLRAWLERLAGMGYLSARAGPGRMASRIALAGISGWVALGAEIGAGVLGDLLARYATPAQQKIYLEPIIEGRLIAAVAASEPLSGSVPKTLETRAQPDGGDFVLSGSKSTVSLAPLADVIGVLGQIEDRPAVFLVERDQAGVELGERLATSGLGQLCTCPLELRDVRLAAEALVGPFDASAVDLLRELRAGWDYAFTAVACGSMRACLDRARVAADVKRVDGKPPAGYQSVRFALAEMLCVSQTAELLALRAAWAAAAGDREAESLALCAKLFATENACALSDKALQISGAAGHIRANPLESAYRDARLGTIMGNTSQVARMAIADDVLEKLGDR